MQQYDVIIAGTGVAGLYAALNFPEDVTVLLLTKKGLTLSNSSLAQGGVAAVVDQDHDNFKLHIADTLIAGGYKNTLSALEVLVTEGPKDVLRLIELGVDFDAGIDGHPHLTLEGGHSRHRILHHKDSTGKEIVDTLLALVQKKPNITLVDHTMICGLDAVGGGFYAKLLQKNEPTIVACNFVLLATGGIGRVYQYTTNSAIATGDGITLAHEVGAKIKNLSLIQFHPTAFAPDNGRERFLISEAVRGEGAVLLNCFGERFMQRYDKRMELAPRDVVSVAVMKEARRTASAKIYLDISFKEADFLVQRFPMICAKCLEQGIDITKDHIPIFPCQHYLMGGIDVDLHSRTSVPHLYAAGECSHTGVHGANRLASNSLLEALVFSRRAALDITEHLQKERVKLTAPIKEFSTDGRPLPKGLRTQIRDIMQSAYFVVPDKIAIREGITRIERIFRMLTEEKFAITEDYIEAKSLATVALIILKEVVEQ